MTGSPSCAEEIGMETIIRLSVDTGNSLHVQTVSTASAPWTSCAVASR
ncbi:MAG: hypothetical protein ACLT8E_01040 [Akkermansia sp.]